jgi:hypothetical protein
MGKYREDHITWTRLYVISALSDSPDLPQTTWRLLQNQVDIGNAIKPYYAMRSWRTQTVATRCGPEVLDNSLVEPREPGSGNATATPIRPRTYRC